MTESSDQVKTVRLNEVIDIVAIEHVMYTC